MQQHMAMMTNIAPKELVSFLSSQHLLCEDINPVVHLVSERPHIAQRCVLRLEDGLVGYIEVEQALFGQIVPFEALSFLVEQLGHESN